jgi:hypothetical protein
MEIKELLERVVARNETMIRQNVELLLVLIVPRGKRCNE